MRRGEGERRAAQARAIHRDVVAGNQRQPLAVRLPPPLERERQQAEQRPRWKGAAEIGDQGRVVAVERPGRRRQAIAFFRHRRRYDLDNRRRERGDGGLGADRPRRR